ncbi:allantoate amidohydrolase [Bacillus methanolicus PB1]|uniref:Allantoate amidohydrolase n=1 Tax=Bacillus methanolicus PB1 TaxID=997296 RepID=I3E1R2_BACMT|nr:allantoate deiminase [Bacillus methanolicus]EIJ80433.1 allantoate amidohydrolase [Bacillus methanolicus PB1]
MANNLHSSFQLGEKVERMIEWLSSFGKTENGGVTRLLYSEPWLLAQEALRKKMDQCGLCTYFDDVGNLFGRAEGTESSSPIILTGSHIDTVIDGGKYDGSYGIISSLLAVEYLLNHYGFPKKTIEVVSLCEEEGSRFPITYWGSGAITGKYTFEQIQEMTDSQGISFVKAMEDCGFGMGKFPSPLKKDIQCFVELHIEQGRILERKGKTLGIVSHISGQRRYNVTVVGESNHAGTTPMIYRKDAVSIASELITLITNKARARDLMATVGKVIAKPNVPNVIAGEVMFTLDVRHHNEEFLDDFCSEILQYLKIISKQNEVGISVEEWMRVKPVTMDFYLTKLSAEIAENQNLSYEFLVSGAGHDSQVFGTYCPTALFFVPSCKGISHSPKEFTDKLYLENGLKFLIEYLYRLAY